MRPRLRSAVALLACSAGSILFLEGTARALLWSDWLLGRIAGVDDASYRLLWVRRHRGGMEINYSFDVFHPTRGWALRAGIRGMSVFDGKTLNTNSRGLRGAEEHSYNPPGGVLRILCLGDSFTFGEGVSDDETFCHRLQEDLPGTEVLNFGVHGYGQDQMLLYLREEGVKYRPDVVILGFLATDMERNVLAFRDYAKPRFVLRSGGLLLTHVPVPTPEETLAREACRSRLGDLLAMLFERYRLRSGRRDAEMIPLTVAILDGITRTAREAGGRPLFVYLPVFGEIFRPSLDLSPPQRFLLAYCADRGIPALDLRPAFLRALSRGVRLKGYGHWGPVEHRIAAEEIVAALRRDGLADDPAGAPGGARGPYAPSRPTMRAVSSSSPTTAASSAPQSTSVGGASLR